MPPKIRFDRDCIINAAYQLARKDGYEAINARAVAKEMGSSTQPLFRVFENMEKLKAEVYKKAQLCCQRQRRRPHLALRRNARPAAPSRSAQAPSTDLRRAKVPVRSRMSAPRRRVSCRVRARTADRLRPARAEKGPRSRCRF